MKRLQKMPGGGGGGGVGMFHSETVWGKEWKSKWCSVCSWRSLCAHLIGPNTYLYTHTLLHTLAYTQVTHISVNTSDTCLFSLVFFKLPVTQAFILTTAFCPVPHGNEKNYCSATTYNVTSMKLISKFHQQMSHNSF